MGVCFSYNWNNDNNNNISDQERERLAAARVIWKSGEVREYAAAVTVTVEEVLADHRKSNKIREDEDYFVCNSDSLYFDQLIPALNSGHQLSSNEIYFVLEGSQRHRPLSAADMASLALKATAALDVDKKKKKKKRFSRVSPRQQHHDIDNYFSSHQPLDYDSDRTIGKARGGGANNNNNNNNNNKLPRSTSSSMKKLQRLTSRRAKLAVRSFRLRLFTIYEST